MAKWKMFLQKKNNLILLLLCGILLLVIAMPQGKGGEETEETVSAKSLEIRLKQTLQKIEGVGELEVMVSQSEEASFYGSEDDGTVQGVLIVCEHGDKPVVVERITEAVQALFDVDTHKIRVMKMNQTKQEENR